MDQTAFAAWLEGIAALTEPQRVVALEALSLPSAEIASKSVAFPGGGRPSAGQPEARPLAKAGGAAGIALLGHRR